MSGITELLAPGRVRPGEESAAPFARASAFLSSPRAIANFYVWAMLAALGLAAASMVSAATPSYDPWSWLVWGRQIIHGTLDTAGGPTWKPLPMVFTTLFAPVGRAQPNLWLMVARWGAILSVIMIFKLTARVVWWMRPAATGEDRLARLAPLAPPLLAGLVATSAMAFSGGYLSDSALGYSEGIAIAFGLISIDRALDGAHRQAFLAGAVVAWDRPESWVFWGPYGLWLMWRDPGARALVIGLAVLTLLAWFVPQKLGGGSFTSGVARAEDPRANSAAFAHFPFWAELRGHAWESVFFSARVTAVLGALAALLVVLRKRRDWRTWLRTGHGRAVAALLLLNLAGAAWWVLISVETQAGFSGNDRYLLLGSALVCICTGITVGWGAVALARAGARLRRLHPATVVLAATAMLALLYGLVPDGWVGSQVTGLGSTMRGLRYQARLRGDMAESLRRAGGRLAVIGCGPVMVENFQVPMAAWYLDRDLDQILGQPNVDARGDDPVRQGRWPSTVFQDRSSPNAVAQPLHTTIAGWQSQGANYRIVRTGEMTMYQACRPRRTA